MTQEPLAPSASSPHHQQQHQSSAPKRFFTRTGVLRSLALCALFTGAPIFLWIRSEFRQEASPPSSTLSSVNWLRSTANLAWQEASSRAASFFKAQALARLLNLPSAKILTKTSAIDPKSLITQTATTTLAPKIPTDRLAEYDIRELNYVSIHQGEKQWKIEADSANLFQQERLVHGRAIRAYLFDPGNLTTRIAGQEAKYFLNEQDLEVFGAVQTQFPDGFETLSSYLRYQPQQKLILIPPTYQVKGDSHEAQGQNFHFQSGGLRYGMGEERIILSSRAKVTLRHPSSAQPQPQDLEAGVPSFTTIEADQCLIDRAQKIALFTMRADRPAHQRFVHITQPTLYTQARRATLHYGDFSQVLQYLTAYDEVFIKEIGPDASSPLRYATGGEANFDTQKDLITLTRFPQVYQDQDTVTGEQIILHRNSNLIEIQHSNAFSNGAEPQ